MFFSQMKKRIFEFFKYFYTPPYNATSYLFNADLDGTWRPVGLNNMIRFIEYKPGGHFSPHYDSHYSFSPDKRTLLTVMMYFSDQFEGGCTEFLSSSVEVTKTDDNTLPVLSQAVCESVSPMKGTCIVFSHHVLHQGGVLGRTALLSLVLNLYQVLVLKCFLSSAFVLP
jgi:hypothetical protein